MQISEPDKTFMQRAIELAQKGMDSNQGGPFGAVIVKDGKIVGEGNNQVTSTNDPTAHAEVVAIAQIHVHDREAVRIFVRERAQQDRVGHAEDGGAGADAQGNGGDGGDGEDRAAAERPPGQREIPQQHDASSVRGSV